MNITPITLTGRFVRLEPLTMAHLDPLWEVARDPELWRWTASVITSREELEKYLAEGLRQQDEEGSAVVFATVETRSGRVAGTTRFANLERAHRRVEIGWTFVGREFQRTAINPEAKRLMLAHAFEAWGMHRVELKTDALNARSRRAIEALGAQFEGTLRRHVVTQTGRVRDTVYYSILDSEWPQVRARLDTRIAARATGEGGEDGGDELRRSGW